MRILADENFPAKAIAVLRELEHDVSWVRELGPGTDDEEILGWAVRESRVLRQAQPASGVAGPAHGGPSDAGSRTICDLTAPLLKKIEIRCQILGPFYVLYRWSALSPTGRPMAAAQLLSHGTAGAAPKG